MKGEKVYIYTNNFAHTRIRSFFMSNKILNLNFNVDNDLLIGVERLKDVLGYEIGEGITVNAVESETLGVSLKGGVANIYYPRKHLFFRELGVLVEKARQSDEFEITEDRGNGARKRHREPCGYGLRNGNALYRGYALPRKL